MIQLRSFRPVKMALWGMVAFFMAAPSMGAESGVPSRFLRGSYSPTNILGQQLLLCRNGGYIAAGVSKAGEVWALSCDSLFNRIFERRYPGNRNGYPQSVVNGSDEYRAKVTVQEVDEGFLFSWVNNDDSARYHHRFAVSVQGDSLWHRIDTAAYRTDSIYLFPLKSGGKLGMRYTGMVSDTVPNETNPEFPYISTWITYRLFEIASLGDTLKTIPLRLGSRWVSVDSMDVQGQTIAVYGIMTESHNSTTYYMDRSKRYRLDGSVVEPLNTSSRNWIDSGVLYAGATAVTEDSSIEKGGRFVGLWNVRFWVNGNVGSGMRRVTYAVVGRVEPQGVTAVTPEVTETADLGSGFAYEASGNSLIFSLKEWRSIELLDLRGRTLFRHAGVFGSLKLPVLTGGVYVCRVRNVAMQDMKVIVVPD